MSFDAIIGQEKTLGFLRNALRSGRLAHAYLFHGPSGVGKFLAAREFAKALLCSDSSPEGQPCDSCVSCRQVDGLSHPGLRVVLPVPSREAGSAKERELLDRVAEEPYRIEQLVSHPSLGIDRIRELKDYAAYAARPGERRVAIIPLAERMTMEAANSFLKLLEEPPEDLYLLLTTTNPAALPRTIVSRCQLLRFSAIPDDVLAQTLVGEHGLEGEKAALIAQLAAGSYGQALEWLSEDEGKLREEAVELLRNGLRPLADRVRFALETTAGGEKAARVKVLALLDVLQLWLRDALLLRELDGDAQGMIANRDQLDVIERFNRGLSEVRFDAIFDAIDETAFEVRRNVTVALSLIGLMGRFHTCLRR